MRHLDYDEGYRKALTDLATWIGRPNAPLDPKLCKSKFLVPIIRHIAENPDGFMSAPDTFCFDFEITKGKLKIFEPERRANNG